MKTIIFDIDGTVFDTKKGIIACLNDILHHYKLNSIPSSEEDKYIGPSIKDSLIRFNGFSEKESVIATEKYRKNYVDKYIEQSTPYKGFFELLSYIKSREYKLCIATMKTKNQVEKLLKNYNILSLFDAIETAKYEGGYTKYDMLNSIKSRFCGDLYFVGDTLGDYNASRKANIKFIYASYGYGNIPKYKGERIFSLLDIVDILEKTNMQN